MELIRESKNNEKLKELIRIELSVAELLYLYGSIGDSCYNRSIQLVENNFDNIKAEDIELELKEQGLSDLIIYSKVRKICDEVLNKI